MTPPVSRRALLGALGAAVALGAEPAVAQPYTSDRVPAISNELWSWLRAQYVTAPGLAWLDTAEFGPTLRAVMVETYRATERQAADYRSYGSGFAGLAAPALRAALTSSAAFLGMDPGEVALTTGAHAGLALVAAGLDLKPGDEVLTTLHEHPAAIYPWLAQARRRGLRVVQLPSTDPASSPDAIVQRFSAAMGPATRVLAISHVQVTDGAVLPVAELCRIAREKGIYTVVDGSLAPGHLDARVADLGCDAYAAGFDRWLNGPVGTGLLYVRRASQAVLWPSWPDHAEGWDAEDRYGAPVAATPDASFVAQQRFGTMPGRFGPGVEALPIAFELQQAVGRPRLATRVRELTARLRAGLARIAGVQIISPSHAALQSGVVTAVVPTREAATLVDAMAREDRIVVGLVRLPGNRDGVRFSVHAAVDEVDLDRSVAALGRRV